ncbi:hypothetical protein [Cryptosporangium sp. NPDC048952]|uniref:hypothetical protein n=1 Tax=Cryptosporangium sp. NPDC048952 TaxID=3363961 RepID=UPI00371C2283
MSNVATRKPGTTASTTHPARISPSGHRRANAAASNAKNTAHTNPRPSATTVSSTVAGRRCPSSAVTARPLVHDVPRSPRRASASQAA